MEFKWIVNQQDVERLNNFIDKFKGNNLEQDIYKISWNFWNKIAKKIRIDHINYSILSDMNICEKIFDE